MAAPRSATITAFTVEIACPHCGECLPNPDNGAFSWMPNEVIAEAKRQRVRVCDSCDETFAIHPQSRVSVIVDPEPLPAGEGA